MLEEYLRARVEVLAGYRHVHNRIYSGRLLRNALNQERTILLSHNNWVTHNLRVWTSNVNSVESRQYTQRNAYGCLKQARVYEIHILFFYVKNHCAIATKELATNTNLCGLPLNNIIWNYICDFWLS